MSFDQRLQRVLTPLDTARAPTTRGHDEAAVLVAVHAPYLLQRFAALAAALQGRQPRGGQGVVLACRNGCLGYRTAEYCSCDLHIVLDATDGQALLRWEARGVIGTRRLRHNTTAAELDFVLLNAVAALVQPWRDGGMPD